MKLTEAAKILNEINMDKTMEEIRKNPEKFFNSLKNKKKSELKKCGCQAWDEPDENGMVLMLFPHQWYDYIPDGYEVVDISNKVEKFIHGKTDNDYRANCLAYGIKVKSK